MSHNNVAATPPEPALQRNSDAVGSAEQPAAGLMSFGDPSAEACTDGGCTVPQQDTDRRE
ncbi:MAG TPA: hypothetical protein VK095_08440 [Beutenbergiaceae bacterium]|nr:hypothetical protein [Beutenbergiaceae bacterium]